MEIKDIVDQLEIQWGWKWLHHCDLYIAIGTLWIYQWLPSLFIIAMHWDLLQLGYYTESALIWYITDFEIRYEDIVVENIDTASMIISILKSILWINLRLNGAEMGCIPISTIANLNTIISKTNIIAI